MTEASRKLKKIRFLRMPRHGEAVFFSDCIASQRRKASEAKP